MRTAQQTLAANFHEKEFEAAAEAAAASISISTVNCDAPRVFPRDTILLRVGQLLHLAKILVWKDN